MKIKSFKTVIMLAFMAFMYAEDCETQETGSCTECKKAMNHLSEALETGRLGCTSYVSSRAFSQVTLNCTNGRDKAYDIVDFYCTGHGYIPSACE